MTDFATAPDGIRIAYEALGAGPPVVLVHGFGSSRVQNWKFPGWYEALSGYRVIAMDCRGHGQSDTPHDPARYDHGLMAGDVITVMEAAGESSAFILGYSMGGFIALQLLTTHPERIEKLVIGGVGASYLSAAETSTDRLADPLVRERLADALLTPDKASISDPIALRFREFAELPGKDRLALAACMRAMRPPIRADVLARAQVPVLVVCGEHDDLTGPPGPLAAAFPNGEAMTVPGRDHMSTVGDKLFKDAVREFFAR
jgi:pimeloyl-ACP methyl ester carboxylesterase